MSVTPPSPKTDPNNQTDESKRNGSELDDCQLDDVSGRFGGSSSTTSYKLPSPPPPPPPV